VGVKKKDRVKLPGESHTVIVLGVDTDDDEVMLFFKRNDGTQGSINLSPETFFHLEPLCTTGHGDPHLALAGLWGYWMKRVITGIRQTTLSTTPLRAYAHQDEAVFEAMLPQPTLRFLLADEPGTGKTVMTGMYMVEMRRRGLIQRVLLAVPAHLVPKWERDLQRFFGLETERLTADMGRTNAPLRPDRDIWVVSVDLLARNGQVQRKAISAEEGTWDLVVFDEAHRLTPTAQNMFPMAKELARRCHHLLLLTATPHRGSEYLFRALLHLLDPDVYLWSPDDARLFGPDTQRLRPARVHFIRRMKENLRDHDNVTPLFPERRAHNKSVPLSAAEQQIYEDSLAYCDQFFDDPSGLVRSVYGKRGASSLYALSETLKRRAEQLQTNPLVPPIIQTLDPSDLATEDEEQLNTLEQRANALSSKDSTAELVALTELHTRLITLLADSSFVSAKWHEMYQTVLPTHGIAPGQHEQLLVFTEFTDTAMWLEQQFRSRGFRARCYTGDISWEERERIQTDFQNHMFEVLIATDAGNEGIDLQSAHVMVNWDIPWSIVRLEQRVGRLHRIGQRSRVDIYNLISTSTREGRVQEVILANIVAAAEALNGQIFDFLGSVVEQLGVDYTGLLVRAGAGGQAAEDALAEAMQITKEQYQDVSRELRQVEDKLATRTDSDTFIAHIQQDRLHAINPAVVAAFMRVLASARGWTMTNTLHTHLYKLQALGEKKQVSTEHNSTKLPLTLGAGNHVLIAVSADALIQARREGADLTGTIVLGPAETPYRGLVDEIVRDADDILAIGAILDDPSALTPYELLIFDTMLIRHQGNRSFEWAYPILLRADSSGIRQVSWQCVSLLQVPSQPPGEIPFSSSTLIQAEVVAKEEAEREALQRSANLGEWAASVAEQFDWLQDEVIEPYQNLPLVERKKRRAAVYQAVAERKQRLQEAATVTARVPRLVGRVQVRATSITETGRVDSDSEMLSMRWCIHMLVSEGFHVDDVHQEGCGYDLRARRGRELRCVEVKGLRGDISPGIMLESSEWLMAQQLGPEYWLYVFTQCETTPTLFGVYRNPIALFGDNKHLVQRFHISATSLRKELTS
jgi:superfamily II DNA or RNA helicase